MSVTDKLRENNKRKTKQRHFYICLGSLSDEKLKKKHRKQKACFTMVV